MKCTFFAKWPDESEFVCDYTPGFIDAKNVQFFVDIIRRSEAIAWFLEWTDD